MNNFIFSYILLYLGVYYKFSGVIVLNKEIRNEIKSYIASSGWTLTDIVNKMNEAIPAGETLTTVQNLSNKLTRGTIKYSEVKQIADIIGYSIEWQEKSK